MQIAKIKIANFRSIKHLELEIPQICALVGPNNAGKSNILLALQKVLAKDWVNVNVFEEEDRYLHNPDNDILIEITLSAPYPYKRFSHSDPVEIHRLKFIYTHYKTGDKEGQPKLDQSCVNDKGDFIFIPKSVPKKGFKLEFEPLIGIPQEIKEALPLVYIGTNRSISEQLPSGRYSMLRYLLEDIDNDLKSPNQKITIKNPDGTEEEVHRYERFTYLMGKALEMLRTDEFKKLEESIRKTALEQLGLDPLKDKDKLELFFNPLDSIDFYKSLELRVNEGGFPAKATVLGEGIQNALVLSILKAYRRET